MKIQKKFVLALMATTILSIPICYADDSGCCNDDCTCQWSLGTNKALIITATGDDVKMVDYGTGSLNSAPWGKDIMSVNFVGDLTGIGTYAFLDATNLTSVDLTGVKTIGDRAFYRATGLTSVNLTGVQSIGSSAFFNVSLSSLTISAEQIETYLNSGGKIDISNIICKSGNCQTALKLYNDKLASSPKLSIDVDSNNQNKTIKSVSALTGLTMGDAKKLIKAANGTLIINPAEYGKTVAEAIEAFNVNDITYSIIGGKKEAKRIYTIDEANQVAGKVNSVKIRYR